MKRDHNICEKRPTQHGQSKSQLDAPEKTRMYVWKETCLHVKRDQYTHEKRLINIWKETYSTRPQRLATSCARIKTNSHVKRDEYTCQKRPIYIWKETYSTRPQ